MRYLSMFGMLVSLAVTSVAAPSHVRLKPIAETKSAADVANDAEWIWADKTSDNQTIHLRYVIDGLVNLVRAATLYITADDYFTVRINGIEIGHTDPVPGGKGWQTVQVYNLYGHFKYGGNEIEIDATNVNGAAGVLVFADLGVNRYVTSDASWEVSADSLNWTPAHVIGPIGTQPWGNDLKGWPSTSPPSTPSPPAPTPTPTPSSRPTQSPTEAPSK